MNKRFPLEAGFWLTALLALAFVDGGIIHFSLCPMANAGLEFCPGCGLGRSISLFLHGRLQDSLQAHPLGIFAVFVLSSRIISLTKQHFRNYGKSY